MRLPRPASLASIIMTATGIFNCTIVTQGRRA